MRDQEIVGLWEAYSSIYESPDSDIVNENIQNKVSDALNTGVKIGKKIEKNPVLGPLMSILKPVRPGTDRGPVTPTHHNVANRQEQFETWVNDLVEEGYDLSDYTWNDMYEMFMNLDEGDGRGREGFRFDYNQKHGRPFITPETSQRASETETLGGGTYQRGPKRLPRKKSKYDKQVLSGVRAASEQEKQRARQRLKKRRSTQSPIKTEEVETDLFDYILEHLVAEGYADTNDAALSIMANMSEEWKQSIVGDLLDEGEKPFPHEKVKAKQVALRDKGGNALDRRMKMGMAVRRAKEARRTGGSQRDAGKGWYHGR